MHTPDGASKANRYSLQHIQAYEMLVRLKGPRREAVRDDPISSTEPRSGELDASLGGRIPDEGSDNDKSSSSTDDSNPEIDADADAALPQGDDEVLHPKDFSTLDNIRSINLNTNDVPIPPEGVSTTAMFAFVRNRTLDKKLEGSIERDEA